jgi:uncharacterized protein YjcR
VSAKSLCLLLQSSRDALGESLAELERAIQEMEALEAHGDQLPVPVSQLERARAQTVAAHRILDDLTLRLG